ncbi:MAG: hypothetical protein KDA45_02605 [Planctomycetales bacterium]|nr:hypothetical protein [Planctomycetales bacterium]
MVRSRDSVLLEFDQLLNLLFPRQNTVGAWFWKERNLESAIQSFCRDASVVIPRSELHNYALQSWLSKRGLQSRPDVAKSLNELLDTQMPLNL